MSIDYELKVTTSTVTIANGASLSDAIDTNGKALVSIFMPADWTAADLTFSGSLNGTDYFNVYDDADNELTIQAGEDRLILINREKLQGARYLKVRSGTSGAAVVQLAERILTIGFRLP
jgi:hypothetical protein